jgi:hypothetical protein
MPGNYLALSWKIKICCYLENPMEGTVMEIGIGREYSKEKQVDLSRQL